MPSNGAKGRGKKRTGSPLRPTARKTPLYDLDEAVEEAVDLPPTLNESETACSSRGPDPAVAGPPNPSNLAIGELSTKIDELRDRVDAAIELQSGLLDAVSRVTQLEGRLEEVLRLLGQANTTNVSISGQLATLLRQERASKSIPSTPLSLRGRQMEVPSLTGPASTSQHHDEPDRPSTSRTSSSYL